MEKYGNWENSSKEMEVDDEESDSENDNIGVGRTYECHYCKRGFTNAQALGGHMNIHRKDKAKARQQQQQQQQQQQSIPLFSYPSSTSYKPFMDPISTYPSFAPQRNGQEYYPFANNNNINSYYSKPSILEGNDEHDLTTNRRSSRFFDAYENQLGSNLSLRMTSSSNDQYQRGKEKKNKTKDGGDYNDIDLELRLGYDR